MVYYRKYRPQTIEELDSKEVREKLSSILSNSESAPHAFLFTGPKGLGKTSTARIVAKVLNCERNLKFKIQNSKTQIKIQKLGTKDEGRKTNDQIEPCNKCDQCSSIAKGTNLDILEIDGASNRGIDEIRDLREKVKLSPISAQKKVYIIDEVHMLTTEAFNALLKTLEEPPGHVVFILCTTESHKVPETILSRCLHVQFKKATNEELVRSFERIIKKEGLSADKEALILIAGLSDGSFRDGVKILEEMALISKGNKITKESVEKSYSIASIQYQTAQIVRSLEDKDTKRALGVVVKLADEGIEMEHFIGGLIETLHNSLLLKVGVEFTAGNSTFTIDNLKLEIPEIKKLIELLSRAKNELKYAVLPQIPLELAIVEWGLQSGIKADIKADEHGSIVPRQSVSKSVSINEEATVIKKDVVINKPSIVTTQQDISKYSENDALWTALIDKVKAYNHSIAGVLRGCRIKSYDGKSLIIETNFKFHKEKLSEIKTQEILNKTIEEITKKNVRIEVMLRAR